MSTDESNLLRSRVIELCRRMLGRDMLIHANNETGEYKLFYSNPAKRTPAAFADVTKWAAMSCDVRPETFEAAWKGQFTAHQPCISIYESNSNRTSFVLKSAGRRLVREQPTEIVNVRYDGADINRAPWFDFYCGRPSAFGNPFKIERDTPEERTAAVRRFASWIPTQPELMLFAGNLRGLRLGCWCMNARSVDEQTPELCHCVPIARIANGWQMSAKGYPIDENGTPVRFIGGDGNAAAAAKVGAISGGETFE